MLFQTCFSTKDLVCRTDDKLLMAFFGTDGNFKNFKNSSLPQTYSHLHMTGPCLIGIACRRWHRQSICIGISGTWNSVCGDPGNRRESGALIGVAITGRGHWRARRSPEGTAISGIVRGRRRREGSTLIRVKRRGHKTVSDDGWRGRGRRGGTSSLVLIRSHAIWAGSVFLIVIYHAIPVPLTIVRTVRINSSSRGRGWQRRGRVTWGHVAEATSQVAGWGRLMPLSWIVGGPIATPVWGRRWIVLTLIMSGTALRNLDMDALACIQKKE